MKANSDNNTVGLEQESVVCDGESVRRARSMSPVRRTSVSNPPGSNPPGSDPRGSCPAGSPGVIDWSTINISQLGSEFETAMTALTTSRMRLINKRNEIKVREDKITLGKSLGWTFGTHEEDVARLEDEVIEEEKTVYELQIITERIKAEYAASLNLHEGHLPDGYYSPEAVVARLKRAIIEEGQPPKGHSPKGHSPKEHSPKKQSPEKCKGHAHQDEEIEIPEGGVFKKPISKNLFFDIVSQQGGKWQLEKSEDGSFTFSKIEEVREARAFFFFVLGAAIGMCMQGWHCRMTPWLS